MEMPVAVGVLVAIIFLIAFSEWFYFTLSGWNQVIIDDRLYKYRVFGASVISVMIIFATFWGAALVTKCTETERQGLFSKLNCEEYRQIVVKSGF